MSNGGVCRTAPATPGVLDISLYFGRLKEEEGGDPVRLNTKPVLFRHFTYIL